MGIGIRSRKASARRQADYRERLQRTEADATQYRAIRSASTVAGRYVGHKLADAVACKAAEINGAHYHGGKLAEKDSNGQRRYQTQNDDGTRETFLSDGTQNREVALLTAERQMSDNGQ